MPVAMMKPDKKPMWVVVLDASYARLFTLNPGAAHPIGQAPELTEFETLAHPEGRMSREELGADGGGTTPNTGRGGWHTTSHDDDPKREELDRFAHEVAHRLNSARTANAFETLALVAAPTMLGLLRHELDEPTRRTVTFELGKHMLHASPRELREALPAHLFA
jgi:protein required for attachment to host cells